MPGKIRVVNKSPDSIDTDRLRLTTLVGSEADELATALFDLRIYEFIGGLPPTVEELGDRFRRLATATAPAADERWLNWIVRERGTGQVVGTVQATITGADALVAWMVAIPWQGRGLGKEAARGLVDWLEASGVKSMSAHIHPSHSASSAVAVAAGFQRTDDVVNGEVVWHRDRPQNYG